MGIQSFVLISSFFSSYAVRELRELRFIIAHFAKIAIKRKRVTQLPRSLAQMKSM